METSYPILSTPRLELIELNPLVMDKLFKSRSEKELQVFFGCNNNNQWKEAKRRFKYGLVHNHRFSFKHWLIRDKQSKEVIGDCGFHLWYIRHSKAEIGYGLNEEKWKRQGLMTEALEKVIEYGFEKMELQRIEAFVYPDNLASQKILIRFGFQKEGLLRLHFREKEQLTDSFVFSLIAPDHQTFVPYRCGTERLVNAFKNKSLPVQEWTHQAHLVVALWFLYHHSVDEATCLIRSGIITYNESVGSEHPPKRGYHETITLFWIHIIHQFIKKAGPDKPLSELQACFFNSEWSNVNLPLEYYSKDRLMSTAARGKWVAPDLKQLSNRGG